MPMTKSWQVDIFCWKSALALLWRRRDVNGGANREAGSGNESQIVHAIILISLSFGGTLCCQIIARIAKAVDEFYVKIIKLPIHPAHTLIRQGLCDFKFNLMIGWGKKTKTLGWHLYNRVVTTILCCVVTSRKLVAMDRKCFPSWASLKFNQFVKERLPFTRGDTIRLDEILERPSTSRPDI